MYIIIDTPVPNPIDVVELGYLKNSTLTFLANYSKSLTEAQQFATQTLLDGMESNGINDYVSNLYLPVLANELSEALLNKKTLINDQASINGTYWELNADGGLKAKTDSVTITGTDRLLIPFGGNGESTQNFHLLFGHMNTLAAFSSESMLFGDIASASGVQLFGKLRYSAPNDYFEMKNTSTANIYYKSGGGELTKEPGVFGLMSDTISKKVITKSGTLGNATVSGSASINAEGDNPFALANRPFLTDFLGSTGANRISAGILSMGKSMPDATLVIYQQLLSTFLSNF